MPRNSIPRRTGITAAKLAQLLAESDLTSVLGVISAAKLKGERHSARDFVLVKGSYLHGSRLSELIRLSWKDIEPLDEGGQVHLLGKGCKTRVVRVSSDTLKLFESLGRGEPEVWLFPSDRSRWSIDPPSGCRSHGSVGQTCRSTPLSTPLPLHPRDSCHPQRYGYGWLHASIHAWTYFIHYDRPLCGC